MTRDELLAMQDRELDAMVAERVMGYEYKSGQAYMPTPDIKTPDFEMVGGRVVFDFAPSRDIAAAWSVVPELLKRGRKVTIEVGEIPTGPYCDVLLSARPADFLPGGRGTDAAIDCVHESPCRALIVAALLAVEASK